MSFLNIFSSSAKRSQSDQDLIEMYYSHFEGNHRIPLDIVKAKTLNYVKDKSLEEVALIQLLQSNILITYDFCLVNLEPLVRELEGREKKEKETITHQLAQEHILQTLGLLHEQMQSSTFKKSSFAKLCKADQLTYILQQDMLNIAVRIIDITSLFEGSHPLTNALGRQSLIKMLNQELAGAL